MKKKVLTVITVFTDGSISVIEPDKEATTQSQVDDTTLGDDGGGNNPNQPPKDP